MHYFLLIYFNNKPLHVSSRLAAANLETSKNRLTHLLDIMPASKAQRWQATKVGV